MSVKEDISLGVSSEHISASEEGDLKALDNVHGDEAIKVLAVYDGDQTWTPEEEKRLRRKIDLKLLPVLCATYAFLYADKVLLGQAALFGIKDDLELNTGNRFSMASSIFYLGFILGAYPVIVLAQRFPIERVASLAIIVWGATLICTPACTEFRGLYAQRFFLGFTEAGISPMFMMIVGGWYKKDEQSLRMGAWYSWTGYVSIFSPLVNYGLGHLKGSLSPWFYMYFFAGALTIICGVVIYFVLPPDPIRARGFNERERYIAVARMRTNNSGVRNTHFKKGQAFELLADVKFWLIFFYAVTSMFANAPISTFQAIIIDGFGFNPLNSLLLMIPSGVYAGSMMLLMTYLAYKFPGWRTYLIIITQLVTMTASLLLWLLPRSALGGLLFPATFSQHWALGNFAGPQAFRSEDAPHYNKGFIVVVITSFVAACLILVYRIICAMENRRRDKTGTAEGFEHAYEDDLTDKKNMQFRYSL
ncbi:Major facilitator superfamily domain general substrate transporter [Penicillium paradoxum]|uniref:Major facilitator superfamily domain general substrate transporter n=1 Tax=Penicillium paradoxum TaxID=176176 RepID=UPI00254785CF|nr:Major facilitator superfamily domain general substrate transporter [Penicillium paradoxum]KAJ5794151.1 Major facilitator superfamily domain general substrate transporter [Penicillium paradoxum]